MSIRRTTIVAVTALLGCGVLLGQAAEPEEIAYTFESGAQGWQVYDYTGGKTGGISVFHPATWERKGGVDDMGYVWADDSRWRIDTPEKPHSILALFFRRSAESKGVVDLRDAEVSLFLRGEKLELKEAKCLFWAFSDDKGTRWHLKGHPLQVPEGKWSDKQTFRLSVDEKLWHRSWARYPEQPGSLDDVLRTCDSFGISFVDFKEEVTGKLAMDDLRFRLKAK